MMTNKVIICHIPYQDNANDNKTSKDDNKERWLIVYLEDEKYIYCYNITTLTERKSRYMKLEITKQDNDVLIHDSLVKFDKIFKIEIFNGIEEYLRNNDEICQEDMTKIEGETEQLKKDPRQKVVEVSKETFMRLNDNN